MQFTTYNAANINLIADIIATMPHIEDDDTEDFVTGFQMNRYAHKCGTPACIAGWAASIAHPEWESLPELDEIISSAAEFFGIEREDAAYYIFLGAENTTELVHVTPAMAASFLRHLAETGVADWERAGYESVDVGNEV